VSARITAATAVRVLEQIRHDRRTIAMLLIVPSLLLFLLSEMLGGSQFDRLGAQLLGMFPFITMFLVTSIAMLRERTSGTLERLMTMPLAKLDLLGGYGVAFALLATVQALVTSAFAFLILGLDAAGSAGLIVLLAVIDAVLGSALGLFASAFASSEFQAVQFMPAFVLPQVLL
jgi:ABC-2 type transport system permease protein